MVIVEERLMELFETLPSIQNEGKSFKPVIGDGGEDELNRFLADFDKQKRTPYPLVWIETPIFDLGDDQEKVGAKIKLIIATNTEAKWSQKVRRDLYFKPILVPVADNIMTALKTSNISDVLDEEKKSKALIYNYSKEDVLKVPYLWDVIVLLLDVEINYKELKKCINYE